MGRSIYHYSRVQVIIGERVVVCTAIIVCANTTADEDIVSTIAIEAVSGAI